MMFKQTSPQWQSVINVFFFMRNRYFMYLCHWMLKCNKITNRQKWAFRPAHLHSHMHASKAKKGLGYNLELCMHQLDVWFLACKVNDSWPDSDVLWYANVLFRNIHGCVWRKMSNCTYGNNLKSYIEYKRVNRKAKERQLGPQQHTLRLARMYW